jgi:hypothetical protein
MLTLRQLLIAAAASLLAYLVVFVFLVRKPITVGVLGDYLHLKTSYLARHANDRKIVILAGSNGRYSHRCEAIENAEHIPCANMSLAAGLSLTWQLSRYRQYFRPGDVLYLPIEYRSKSSTFPVAGEEAPYLVEYSKSDLLHLKFQQAVHGLFYFDLRYLLSALGEMALGHFGLGASSNIDTMTPEGDELGHDDRKAAPYVDYLRRTPIPIFTAADFSSDLDWSDIAQILDWARDAGVIAVGGLPTMVDEVQLPANAIPFLHHFYAEHGACLLVLPNESLYPRSDFYNTFTHLRESAQIAHSQLLAPYLASTLKAGKCPFD